MGKENWWLRETGVGKRQCVANVTKTISSVVRYFTVQVSIKVIYFHFTTPGCPA